MERGHHRACPTHHRETKAPNKGTSPPKTGIQRACTQLPLTSPFVLTIVPEPGGKRASLTPWSLGEPPEPPFLHLYPKTLTRA